MAPPASAHVQAGPAGPWVATAPSSCLFLHPDTAGLSEAACRSSWGVGGPRSVRAVVKTLHAAPQR
eukprot:2861799-Alexandrium_andersonii.AAC.1